MPRRLYIEELYPEQITIIYSVLHEVLTSLDVLSNPKHHPLHAEWAVRILKKMSPEMKANLRLFHIFWDYSMASDWSGQPYVVDYQSFSAELDYLAQLDSETFFKPFLDSIFPLETPARFIKKKSDLTYTEIRDNVDLQARFNEWLATYFPASLDFASELFADNEALQHKLINFLQSYWEDIFAEEWVKIEPLLLQDIGLRGRYLFRDGVFTLLSTLERRFGGNVDQQIITIQGHSDWEMRFQSGDELWLLPSYFSYPHLQFSLVRHMETDQKKLALFYTVHDLAKIGVAPVPPEQLLEMLKASGDWTRLQILRLLASKKRTTQELAKIIGISEAAVSKHLKQLQRAGWVTMRRASYYVFYEINAAGADIIYTGLKDFLQNEA